MREKREVLIPEYLEKFSCIGSFCEDTCCAGWRVDLDKKTYLKYKNNKDMELEPIFSEYLRRFHNKKTDSSYGKIVMKKNGECPFLDDDKLCKIQFIKGLDFLSNTCALYPRTTNKVDGKLERSATVSCPEIARLLLFNENGVTFKQIEEDTKNRVKVNREFDTEGHLFFNKPERYFWEIRMFSLNLLQNRKYALSERLTLLGIVYKKIENFQQEKRTHEIPKMLETMEALIDEGSLYEDLKRVPVNIEIQMRLTKEMADEKFNQGIKSSRYLECFKETLMGLNYVKGYNFDNVTKKYSKNYQEFYKPYIEEKEYILENYLVNEYFRNMMPFGSYKSIWDSYIFLCVMYSMIKLHMIGVSGAHKQLNDEIVLKIIQSFSKVVMHNNMYIQKIIELIKTSGFDSLAYMAILIKN